MKITDFLDASRIIPSLRAKDKKGVLREMAEEMAFRERSVNAEKLLAALLERENISSTAIGEGVAIPHGKISGIPKVSGILARSAQGIDFDSLDGGPTYLFFLLVAPENSAADHLKALARISRILKDSGFRARLMGGKSPEEIFNAIQQEDAKF